MPRDASDVETLGAAYYPGIGSKATALERISSGIETALERGMHLQAISSEATSQLRQIQNRLSRSHLSREGRALNRAADLMHAATLSSDVSFQGQDLSEILDHQARLETAEAHLKSSIRQGRRLARRLKVDGQRAVSEQLVALLDAGAGVLAGCVDRFGVQLALQKAEGITQALGRIGLWESLLEVEALVASLHGAIPALLLIRETEVKRAIFEALEEVRKAGASLAHACGACDLHEARESAKQIANAIPTQPSLDTGAVLRKAEQDTHELRSYLPYAASAIEAARAVDGMLEALAKAVQHCNDLEELMPQYSSAEVEGREHSAWAELSKELHEQGLRDAEEARLLEMARLQRGPVSEVISLVDTAWLAGSKHVLVRRLILATESWLAALCTREVVVAALGARRESDQMRHIVEYALGDEALGEGPLQLEALAGSTAALSDSMRAAGHHIEARRVERVATAMAEMLLASKHREARLAAEKAAEKAARMVQEYALNNVYPEALVEERVGSSETKQQLREGQRLVLSVERGGVAAMEACIEFGRAVVAKSQQGNLSASDLRERSAELSSMAVAAWLAVDDDSTARAAQQLESQAEILRSVERADAQRGLTEAEAAKAWARPQVSATWEYVAMQLRKKGKAGPAEIATRISGSVRSGTMGGADAAQMLTAVEGVAAELRGGGEQDDVVLNQVLQGMRTLQEAEHTVNRAKEAEEDTQSLAQAAATAETRRRLALDEAAASLVAAIAGLREGGLTTESTLVEGVLAVSRRAHGGEASATELYAALHEELQPVWKKLRMIPLHATLLEKVTREPTLLSIYSFPVS